MKKTAVFLILSALLMGCNQNKTPDVPTEVGEEQTEKSSACKDFDEYDSLVNLNEKKAWLKKYGHEICEEILNTRVLGDHDIQPGSFSVLHNQNKLTKTLQQINAIISNYGLYDKYISFDMSSGVKDLILVDEFTDTVPCYSIALFRSIINKNQGHNITFEFLKAKVGSTETVIINVIGGVNPVSYYDYSDEPKILDGVLENEKSPL